MATEALMKNLALPNTSRITNAFDSVGRLTSTCLLTPSSSLLNAHSYQYNLASQRMQQARTDASTVTYTYDNIGQLQSARGSGGQSTENLGYLYDTAWKLSKRTNAGSPTVFGVNVKNELTTVGADTCTYDYNGNLTYYGAAGNWQRYFGYDDENQLTSAQAAGYAYSAYTYDGRGRLRKRVGYTWSGSSWMPSSPNSYVYDGMRVIQERDAANVPTVAYTRGNDLSGSLEGAGGDRRLAGPEPRVFGRDVQHPQLLPRRREREHHASGEQRPGVGGELPV